MKAVLKRGDEDTATLIIGNPGLFDHSDGREQRLDRVTVIPCRDGWKRLRMSRGRKPTGPKGERRT